MVPVKKIVSLLLIAICSLTLSLGCSGDKKGTSGTSGSTSGSPSGSKTTPP